jgi:hypothetical protein
MEDEDWHHMISAMLAPSNWDDILPEAPAISAQSSESLLLDPGSRLDDVDSGGPISLSAGPSQDTGRFLCEPLPRLAEQDGFQRHWSSDVMLSCSCHEKHEEQMSRLKDQYAQDILFPQSQMQN